MTKRIVSIIFLALAIVPPYILKAQQSQHSALREGDWWRIRISSDGIYRITPSDIGGMAGCNIADIVVCGSQGGPLATTNGQPRPDDLEEMAIDIHDNNGNGLFDNDDYILFYATGPDRWSYDSQSLHFVRRHHPYSLFNYVFISHQPGSHRRITTAEALSSSSSITTTARALTSHELDKVNTHRSGQIWVGEKFTNSNSQQTISIPLTSACNGAANVSYALAAISTASCSFQVTTAGQSQSHILGGASPYLTNRMSLTSASGTSVNVTIKFSSGESMATGYLDFVDVDAEVTLRATAGTAFYSTHPHGGNLIYGVAGATATTRVWDVTDYNNVVQQTTATSGSLTTFTANSDIARHFAIFSPSAAATPTVIQKLDSQDIHGTPLPDMVIVCHSALKSAASRLASIHSIHDQMEVLVVTQEQVFNEFSSGQQDPMAIREMLRHFRSRAANEGGRQVSHLLLFGKGNYDNKDLLGNGLATVVTYQTAISFDDDGTSICTDDIFTYLDDGEGLATGTSMDIAVGRLPAKTVSEANHLVDKIERYITKSDLVRSDIRGDWRNSIALLADDADPSCTGDTAFTTSSEYAANNILARHPRMNIDKIYADAYTQQSGADGSFYPDVNNALKKRMNYGCLLLNYIGHGSSQYIGTERFMMKSDISSYKNHYQLPYFITSTCTFGRFDDPAETCGGEEFILAQGGGIACLAATRPISHVQAVNNDMIMLALEPGNTIGQAVRKAKNNRYTTQALTLLGDPALKLSAPSYNAVVTKVNGHPVDPARHDTALVLSTVTIEGEIRDADSALVTDFDGLLYPEVYDRAKEARTMANDNDGCEVGFLQQNNVIYRGRAAIDSGRFTFRFIVPRDVPFRFDLSRISLYAKSATADAGGAYTNLLLGGYDTAANLRELHPTMRLFINDTNFINGGITDANPTLLVMLHDSVGINAVGSGLGHDMTAVIDGNNNSTIVLNDLYETDIDDEHCGTVRYSLSNLPKGRHTITVKAWNIFNYSTSRQIAFYVQGDDSTKTDLVAYPTPASSHVNLSLEHNIKGRISSATLHIYDIYGRLVRTFTPSIQTDSYVVGPVVWDLTSAAGSRVPRGIYVAHIELATNEGEKIYQQTKIVVQ